MPVPSPGFGIYIHWPFCRSKCPYCDFNSHVRERIDHARWRSALLAELEHYARDTEGRTVTSIFFGGGTPSLMEPETVAALIARVRDLWPVADGHRDHAGSQPDLRRDRQVPRLPRRRRQSRVARRAEPGGGRPAVPRPPARCRAGAGGGADGGQHVRPLLLRPHLRASEADARAMAPGAGPRAGVRRRPHLALPADHRARHAVRAGGGARRFPRAGRRARGRALRGDGRAPRRRRPRRLRDLQLREGRRGIRATTSPTGATATMSASAPARTAASPSAATSSPPASTARPKPGSTWSSATAMPPASATSSCAPSASTRC